MKIKEQNNWLTVVFVSAILMLASGFVTFSNIDSNAPSTALAQVEANLQPGYLNAHFNPVTGEFETPQQAKATESPQANGFKAQITSDIKSHIVSPEASELQVYKAPNGTKYVRTPLALFKPLIASRTNINEPLQIGHNSRPEDESIEAEINQEALTILGKVQFEHIH